MDQQRDQEKNEPVTSKGIESRRSPRRVYDHPAGILYLGNYVVVQARQLSEGGMLFDFTDAVTVGDRLLASLVLPTAGALVARGQILYQRTGLSLQVGVKFLDLPLHLRRLIRNYVTAKTQEEAEIEKLANKNTTDDLIFEI